VQQLEIQSDNGASRHTMEGSGEPQIRVISNRGELARRLLGAGRRYAPDRDAVAELIAEPAAKD
jgi:hypothetical protein